MKYEKKMAYLRHQKFLAHNHCRQKKSYNGQQELESIHKPLFGEVVFAKKLKILTFKEEK